MDWREEIATKEICYFCKSITIIGSQKKNVPRSSMSENLLFIGYGFSEEKNVFTLKCKETRPVVNIIGTKMNIKHQ